MAGKDYRWECLEIKLIKINLLKTSNKTLQTMQLKIDSETEQNTISNFKKSLPKRKQNFSFAKSHVYQH